MEHVSDERYANYIGTDTFRYDLKFEARKNGEEKRILGQSRNGREIIVIKWSVMCNKSLPI